MTATKKPSSSKKNEEGFSAEEKAAMKERAKELKAEAKAKKNRVEGEKAILEKIAEMEESSRKSSEASAAVGGLITVLSEREYTLAAESGAALTIYRQKIGWNRILKLFT